MTARWRATLLVACLLVGACASGPGSRWRIDHPLGCRPDERRLVRDTLYFGRSMPDGGAVAEADWDRFERESLLPAFADGYTVLDASGRWRDADSAQVVEPSRLVIWLHVDTPDAERTVAGVVADYRARFRQRSVLRERVAACASF